MQKKLILVLLLLFVLPLVAIWLSDRLIANSAHGKTYDSVTQIPHQKVGLVLGTAKRLRDGRLNLYFKYRVDAAVELYQSKKINYILVSGDNGSKGYDEPTDFREELINRGIPAHKIHLDYAGFRTLDSVVRAKEIFGLQSFTVVSQRFHNERAIYLAKQHGITTIGYNATDIGGRWGLKTRLREYLARTKAIIDVLLGVQPNFLGESVVIE